MDPVSIGIVVTEIVSLVDWKGVGTRLVGESVSGGTKGLFRRLGGSDQDKVAKEAVRQVAVRELVRGWQEGPGTLKLLQERARTEAHPAVRHAALDELKRRRVRDSAVKKLLSELPT